MSDSLRALRRLVSKCLIQGSRQDSRELLNTHQLGNSIAVATAAGVDFTEKSFKKVASSSNKAGFSQIDLQNACNSVEKSCILDAVTMFGPGIAALIHFCYSKHSYLFFVTKLLLAAL